MINRHKGVALLALKLVPMHRQCFEILITISAQTNGTVSKATDRSDLLALTDDVVRQAQAISEYLRANKYAEPTFATDSICRPDMLEYTTLRSELKGSMEDLRYLVEGPKRHFRAPCY